MKKVGGFFSVIALALALGSFAAPSTVWAEENKTDALLQDDEGAGDQGTGDLSKSEPGNVQSSQSGDGKTPGTDSTQILEPGKDQTAQDDETESVTVGWNGFHQSPDSKDWYYYKNGKPAVGVNDVIKGKVKGTTAWWHVVDGKVTFDNTVAKNKLGWWYIKNGKVDFSYNGFASNANGTWKITDGKVTFKENGVLKYGRSWYYFSKGRVVTGPTVAKNKNGWWYINSKGKVDFKYNGFAKNKNGWWYCKGGKVQFGTSSVVKGTVDGTNGWWHVVGGKVKFDNTVAQNKNGWWHIQDGKVNFNSNTVAKNKNGWWVVREGKVKFNYNGFAENSNGWWYCKGGKVQFGTSSVLKGTVDGTNGWWHVVGGKVKFDNTVAQNKNGWWHIQDGKVNFNSNTVAKNKNGWWVIRKGKVNFSYNGFAENSNGWWYCKGGKVQFGVTGVFKGTVDGKTGWWYVVGGKVDFDREVSDTYIEDKINEIQKYKNVKYRSGGASPSGWDCSGFTQWAMKYMGVSIPRTAIQQASGGLAVNVKKPSAWLPGDILIYTSGGRVNHVALYLGDGKLMHALSSRYNTLIQDVDYYEKWDKKNTLSAVRRYL